MGQKDRIHAQQPSPAACDQKHTPSGARWLVSVPEEGFHSIYMSTWDKCAAYAGWPGQGSP